MKIKFLYSLLILATFLMLTHAICSGDEGIIFHSVKAWVNAGFDFKAFLANPYVNHSYVAHHFFWFFMQAALYILLIPLRSFFPILKNDLFFGAIITYSQVATTLIAIAMTYLFLRKKHLKELAFLSTSFIWLGGYGIGLLTGGFVDSVFCIAVLAFLWSLSGISEWTPKNIVIMALISFLLTAIKQYGLIFCLIYFTLHFLTRKNALHNIRFFIGYLTILALLLIPWFWARYVYFYSPNYYISWIDSHGGLLPYTKRIFDMLFGLSYGLVWTAPFLVLALTRCSSYRNREVWVPKLASVGCFLLFLGIFYDGVSIASLVGNRYIFPFLLVFIPETTEALKSLLIKNAKWILLVPAFILLFFPTLQYRHSTILLGLQHETTISLKGNRFFSDFIIDLHPALFAWKVQVAKWLGKKEVPISIPNRQNIVLETNRIAPITVGARLIYSLTESPRTSTNFASLFRRLPPWIVPLIKFVHYTLLMSWLTILICNCSACFRFSREKLHANPMDEIVLELPKTV